MKTEELLKLFEKLEKWGITSLDDPNDGQKVYILRDKLGEFVWLHVDVSGGSYYYTTRLGQEELELLLAHRQK